MVAITADPLLIPAVAVDLDTIATDAAIGLPDAVVKPVSLMPPLSLIPSLSLMPPLGVALAAPPPRRASEASSESEPDSCRISFRASRDVYFFPPVLAQNTCNFSRLTCHPSSKFRCGLEKNYGL
jgi:hypothetical protein